MYVVRFYYFFRRLANSSSELSKDKESDFKQELPTPSTSPIVPLAIPNDTTEFTINAEDTYAQTESRLRMPLLPRLEDICQPSKPRTKYICPILNGILCKYIFTFRVGICRISPSSGARAALKVINDALHQLHHKSATKRNPSSPASNFDNATRSANQVVQTEWFQVSSTERANPLDVEDYLDCFEEFSNDLMRYVVNMTDTNVRVASAGIIHKILNMSRFYSRAIPQCITLCPMATSTSSRSCWTRNSVMSTRPTTRATHA